MENYMEQCINKQVLLQIRKTVVENHATLLQIYGSETVKKTGFITGSNFRQWKGNCWLCVEFLSTVNKHNSTQNRTSVSNCFWWSAVEVTKSLYFEHEPDIQQCVISSCSKQSLRGQFLAVLQKLQNVCCG